MNCLKCCVTNLIFNVYIKSLRRSLSVSKTIRKKLDPYACVRREIPRPGHVITTIKDYIRKREKLRVQKEIEREMGDYDKDYEAY